MNSLRSTVLALALLLVAEVPAALAQDKGEIVLAQAGMSMDQAISMVEKRFKARVVRAETKNEDGRTVYVLRLLNDSRVWTVRVDAQSGSVH